MLNSTCRPSTIPALAIVLFKKTIVDSSITRPLISEFLRQIRKERYVLVSI